MKKRILCVALVTVLLLSTVGCSGGFLGVFTGDQTQEIPPQYIPPVNDDIKDEEGEKETKPTTSINVENPFISAEKFPESTVALNASESSYYYFRNLVNKEYTLQQLQKCSYAFKTEEFLNYFGFAVAAPKDDEMFGVGTNMIVSPWNESTMLLQLTFKSEDVDTRAPANFVFHIDLTESMAREDVLPLFKTVFTHFIESLGENDVVSVVVCSDIEEVIIDGFGIDRKDEILDAVEELEVKSGAGGSGELGLAYDVAHKNYIEGGNNRVILVSDGDASEKLTSVIESQVEQGIYASVLCFGDSNHRNSTLEKLAVSGEGRYYYIDSELQGKRVLGDEIFKCVIDIANDTVLKIDFDSQYVLEYRLIGYVYQGDTATEEVTISPAGKIYAGDCITVCYELKLVEDLPEATDFASVELTFTDGAEKLQRFNIGADIFSDEPDEDMLFMSCVIKTIMVLQKSEYIGKLTLGDIYEELEEMDLSEYPKREEFRELIYKIVFGKK